VGIQVGISAVGSVLALEPPPAITRQKLLGVQEIDAIDEFDPPGPPPVQVDDPPAGLVVVMSAHEVDSL
jgi:hypothetical protein